MNRSASVPIVLLAAVALALPAAAGAAPAWLAPSDLTELSDDRGSNELDHAVGMAADGTVVAIGVDGGTGPERLDAWVAAPGGDLAQPPQRLSSGLPMQFVSKVRLAVDAAGNAVAIWLEGDGSMDLARAAYKPAGSAAFGQAQTLSAANAAASDPDVAIVGGTATAVWSRVINAKRVVETATRPAGAAAFGSAAPLSVPTNEGYGARVAMSADGTTMAAWVEDEAVNKSVVRAAVRAPGAGLFSTLPNVYTNTASGGQINSLRVALAPDGRATLAWASYDGISMLNTISSAARGTAGAFSPPDTVSAPGEQMGGFVSLAVDDQNTAVAVWGASVIRAATRPSGGAFSDATSISPPITSGSAQALVAFAPGGRAIATWDARSSDGDVAVQAAEMPRGGAFGAVHDVDVAASTVTFPAEFQGPVAVAVDGEGNAITLYGRNQDVDPGSATSYRFQYRTARYDGAPPALSVAAPSSASPGSPVAMSAEAVDRVSRTDVTWNFGDGATTTTPGTAGPGAPARFDAAHAYASPGTYTVTATATDAVGNATVQTAAISVREASAAPPPGPPTPPGPLPKPPGLLGASVAATWSPAKTYTKLKSLAIRKAPAGATIVLSCKGLGCGKRLAKSVRLRVKKAGTVSLTKYFNYTAKPKKGHKKGARVVARLKPKTVIKVTVTSPGKRGIRYAATIQKTRKKPKVTRGCLAPGSATAAATCAG